MRKSDSGKARFSRRSFGQMLVAAPVAPQVLSRNEEVKAANERRLLNARTLAKLDLPAAAEPAFVFRP